MSDLIVSNIICFQTRKHLATLNSIGVLLKDVLTDLHAHDFVQVKTLYTHMVCTYVTMHPICAALLIIIFV